MSPLGRARQGTYSIVALDRATGELGVAVQSHWFSVGPVVPWARPGVGAVATQANAEIAYGPKALELLAAGASPQDALAQLLAADPAAATRQVAVVDAAGRVAVHTGEATIAHAGHATGDGVSCQANIMADPSVWPAMLAAYEAAGGDLRGRQSAALLVVAPDGAPYEAAISLRVEDDPEPLPELRRLLDLHDAYALAGRADELLGSGSPEEAARLYRRAGELAPDSHELLFWAGIGTAQLGDLDGGAALVARAIALHAAWAELLGRLPQEMAPSAPALRDRLGL
ncbi:MAG TPA: DUF1028 domain-containing protein [Solirubrobacteraceae bacterium]|nr:DUF1028 domain-containing protein [Solirubrobacteraceae bacterium]